MIVGYIESMAAQLSAAPEPLVVVAALALLVVALTKAGRL